MSLKSPVRKRNEIACVAPLTLFSLSLGALLRLWAAIAADYSAVHVRYDALVLPDAAQGRTASLNASIYRTVIGMLGQFQELLHRAIRKIR